MPRFVILQHDYPNLHWDLMLEDKGELLTWKLCESPEKLLADINCCQPKFIEVKKSLPHRLVYLDYEGTISNNRGSVTRCDAGDFHLLDNQESHLTAKLLGKKFKGLIQLNTQ